MYFRMGRKQFLALAVQFFALIVSLFFLLHESKNSSQLFVVYARFGVLVISIAGISFLAAHDKAISVQTVFLLLFVLFQFGLPVVYACMPEYFNYYISLFDKKILIKAIKYTILSIQTYIFCTSLVVVIDSGKKKKKTRGRWLAIIENHTKSVEVAALYLFCFTAAVVVPVNMASAVRAVLADGAIVNMFRGAMAANGVTRFFQEFYFPSALLYLCFSSSPQKKKIVSLFYLVVSFSMVLVADRSGGITALVVFAFYHFYTSKNKKQGKQILFLAASGIFLAVVSSVVATVRISGKGIGSALDGRILLNVIEEMGFNFTSLCFVMDYIPAKTDFRYGLSYLVSFILLIPKTFGLGSVYPALQSCLGETWLWNANRLYGRGFLDFGVGFSLIAESYYNFSWAGIFVMIPISVLITKIINEDKADTAWGLYIRLVLLLTLFTVPRRQFLSILKGIEYSIFFMVVYLIAFIGLRRTENS